MAIAYYEIGEDKSNRAVLDKRRDAKSHERSEIMLFLDVDAKIQVEDKKYFVKPFDVIVVREKELHRFYRHVPSTYKRIILGVHPEFYEENRCMEYRKLFEKSSDINSHKIPAELVKTSGLYDAFMRYKEYSRNYSLPWDTPILRALVIEIIYLINKCYSFVKTDSIKDSIKPILEFLDKNYMKDITLNTLCEKFFISKQYLCKAFQESTGLTVYRYIQRKRLLRIKELKRDGVSTNAAIAEVGFHNYTAFYRAYKKEYGTTPKKGLG